MNKILSLYKQALERAARVTETFYADPILTEAVNGVCNTPEWRNLERALVPIVNFKFAREVSAVTVSAVKDYLNCVSVALRGFLNARKTGNSVHATECQAVSLAYALLRARRKLINALQAEFETSNYSLHCIVAIHELANGVLSSKNLYTQYTSSLAVTWIAHLGFMATFRKMGLVGGGFFLQSPSGACPCGYYFTTVSALAKKRADDQIAYFESMIGGTL